MNELAPQRMTIEEFLDWSKDRPGRYELLNGRPVQMMSPERILHVRTKLAVVIALRNAIAESGIQAEAITDGIGVRIGDRISFEPDCLVYCGPAIAGTELYVPNPLIIVEVLSPSTQGIDVTTKLEHYFKLESLQHYLIVDPDDRCIVHHRRRAAPALETLILRDGELSLDPPGLSLRVADLFPAA